MNACLLLNFIRLILSLRRPDYIRSIRLSHMTSIVIQSRRWTSQPDDILGLGAKPGAADADAGAEVASETGRAGAHQSDSQPAIRPERSRKRGQPT